MVKVFRGIRVYALDRVAIRPVYTGLSPYLAIPSRITPVFVPYFDKIQKLEVSGAGRLAGAAARGAARRRGGASTERGGTRMRGEGAVRADHSLSAC